ncbi:758_t:CDS:2 [Acaulospora morrowiae]|uniref:758_t:CDS:1 n=1 Tax=Acaulospora morrowiae TaxID=94023 RepID=A0A9N9BAI5_9GLOM|nr:758_t:CDS:2 [Acaulospora morrowiae]
MSTILTRVLLQDLAQLFAEADDHNVVINVGQGAESENFKAHSVILRARSPYFRTALSKNWAKKEGDFLIFNKPNITPNVFRIILKYIYTGVCSFENDLQSIYMDILIAADELALPNLVSYVQNHIISNDPSWLQQNIVNVLNVTSLHETFTILIDYCGRLIEENPEILFKSKDFCTIKSSTLTPILKRDLKIEEVEIWDHLIAWGIKQKPELDADITGWNFRIFKTLRNRLDGMIQHIRFYNMTGQQFYEKIWPMNGIISRNLVDELLRFYLVPGNKVPKNYLPIRRKLSGIVSSSQLAVLKNWIEGSNEIDGVCERHTYEKSILDSTELSVEDYEVFRVVAR